MISWPSTLPQHLLVQGFGQSLPEGRVRSANDVGPPKVRRRSSQNVHIITGQMVMTFDQWADLQTFVNSTTGGGTLPFLFRDPLSKIEPKLEIDFTVGTALIQGMPLLVRFGETLPGISEALGSDLVRVTMELEVLPGPTGDFNGDVTDILQVTRASKATYFDAGGVLRTADNNELRVDHDPVTGEPRGLLIEAQSRNRLLWSEDFTNGVWQKIGVSVTPNAAPAPDGNTTADLITESAAEGLHYFRQNATIPAGVAVAGSCFVARAPGAERHVQIFVSDSAAANGVRVGVNLGDGEVVTANVGAGELVDAFAIRVGEFWRVIVVATVGAEETQPRMNIMLATTVTTSIPSYTGDGSSGIYAWGAQLEALRVATSYIKTEGSQVTRATDNVSIPLSAFPWNEAEMTAVAEFSTLGDPVAGSSQILARDGDGRFFYHVSSGFLRAYDGTNILELGALPKRQVVRAAVSFGPRGLRGCINGGAVVSTSFDGAFGDDPALYLGSHNGANPHCIHFRELAIYPRQLPDDELRAVTI